MRVTELKLYQFKNHKANSWQFCDKINAFAGLNGVGKTNILDALYYLSNTKSYFNHSDQQLVLFGEGEASVYAKIHKDQEFEILGSFGEGRKKTFKKNGKAYSRLVDHIGFVQAVFITPYDISLVFEGSEERRKFIDFTISQLDKEYLHDLIEYRKVIEQRNAFLKSLDGRLMDTLLLESFDRTLVPIGNRIYENRKSFLGDFLPIFQEIHDALAQSTVPVSLVYESSLNESSFKELLQNHTQKDVYAQRTTQGLHKDYLIFEINNMPLKKFGSQGQIKTFVVALKLAQYQYLRRKSGDLPILLLDDIFEKIDASRSQRLMEMVCSPEYGQIFISDTHGQRIKEHFDPFDVAFKLFELTENPHH